MEQPEAASLRSRVRTLLQSVAVVQLRAVLRKNVLETIRNKRDAVRELVVPLVLLIALTIVVNLAGPQLTPARAYASRPVEPLASLAGGRALWFAPCDLANISTVSSIALAVQANTGVPIRCFPCEAGCAGSLLSTYTYPDDRVVAGVVIRNTSLPVRYTLLLNAERDAPGAGSRHVTAAYTPDGTVAPPDSSASSSYLPLFVSVQVEVERAISAVIATARNVSPPPRVALSTRQFPSNAYYSSILTPALAVIIPIYMTLIFTLQVRVYLTRILEEKQRKLKTLQKMMGLSDESWWAAWLITAFVKNLPLITIVPIVACTAGIFPHTSFTLVWVFFLLFQLTCISFAVGVSAFFNDAAKGGIFGMVAYLSMALPSYAFTTAATPAPVKVFLSLFAPFAFNLGMVVITRSEQLQRGVTWDAINDPNVSSAQMPLAPLVGMLALDVVLYAGLAWYLDKVVPSAFGTSRHPLFCLGYRRSTAPAAGQPVHADVPLVEDLALEAATSEHDIVVDGLCKHYGDSIVVNDLSMRIREGHVTCLLGHNGAGKTTTLGMLTGLVQPSSGDARVRGVSVVNDMANVRAMMGVCMQDDVLFDHLTVLEHLLLYGGIKGLTPAAAAAQAHLLLADLDLTSKQRALGRTLSGGQKRRVCLAIAFMGDPRVLYLDEPTSGLDPASRRQVWRLIQQHKAGRVIILTTHFMDEAEILGDRIALLSHGRLRACGSPLFMKNAFGLGYHLTAVLPAAHLATLLEAVQARVPAAQLSTQAGGATAPDAYVSADIELPLRSTDQFARIFSDLDAAEPLHLQSYGVRAASLEEMFLQLAPGVSGSKDVSIPVLASPPGNAPWIDVASPHRMRSVHGRGWGAVKETWRLVMIQLWRRRIHFTRDLRSLWLQILTPLLFVAAGIILTLLRNVGGDAAAAPMQLSPAQFAPALSGTQIATFAAPILATSAAAPAWPGGVAFLPALVSSLSSLPNAPAARQVTVTDLAAAGVDAFVSNSTYAAAALLVVPSGGIINATLWFNTSLTAGIPIMTNLLSQALLNMVLNNTGAVIQGSFAPFPLTEGAGETTVGNYLALGLLGFLIASGFNTIPAVVAGSTVEERENKSKQLQLIMGLHPVVFWAANWLWDVLQYIITGVGAVIIVTLGTGHDIRHNNFVAICLLFGAFGLVIPGPAYVASFCFDRPAVAQMYTRLGFSAATIILYFSSFALEYPTLIGTVPGQSGGAAFVRYIGMLFPPYALAKGFMDITIMSDCREEVELAHITIPCETRFPFSWDVLGAKLFFMLITAPAWFAAVLWLEQQTHSTHGRRSTPVNEADGDGVIVEDADVQAERAHVENLLTTPDAAMEGVVLRNLRQVYAKRRRQQHVAVDRLSIAVPPGECFALLGPNGAGKTTTISAMVGELVPTSGSIRMFGADVFTARESMVNVIGYTPQTDALFGFLTGGEVLTYYLALSGVPASEQPAIVAYALASLELSPFTRRQTRHYSGGMKRRLSLLLAYITSPSVVILDEPSTGVDPGARRKMFDLIRAARAGRTTFLTTHVMEDADALSNRIGILIGGRLACLGSAEHLKQKFGRGYVIEVRAAAHDVALQQRVAGVADAVTCVEQSGTYSRFEAAGVRLAPLFELLEQCRQDGTLVDYAVSRTTLEQVFLQLCAETRS